MISFEEKLSNKVHFSMLCSCSMCHILWFYVRRVGLVCKWLMALRYSVLVLMIGLCCCDVPGKPGLPAHEGPHVQCV